MLMHFSTGVQIEVDANNALILQVSDPEEQIEQMRNLFNEESVARIKKLLPSFLLVISVNSLQTMRNLFLTFPFLANVGIVIDQPPGNLINSLLIVFNKKWTLYSGAIEIEAILQFLKRLVDPGFYGTGPPGGPDGPDDGPGGAGSAPAQMIQIESKFVEKLLKKDLKYSREKRVRKDLQATVASLQLENMKLKKCYNKTRVQLSRARKRKAQMNQFSFGDFGVIDGATKIKK